MNETDTLRGLIERAKRERDTSVRQLALLAKNEGFKIVGTTLSGIVKGTYHSQPSNDTIRAIAWLAGVKDEVAFAAAGRPNPGPPFADELPPGVDDLSDSERKAVIAILRSLVAQRQEINRYVDSSSGTQESEPSGETSEDEKTEADDKVTPLRRRDRVRKLESPEDARAARKRNPRFSPEDPDAE